MTLPSSGSRIAAAGALLGLIAVLASCAETDRYPVSGRPCGADDTVQDIRAGVCIPPG